MVTFIIGFSAGLIGGMGIGGGTILIPSLVFLLNTKQQIAQSVNLLSFIPAASVAIIVHIKNKNIETKILIKLIILGCIGAISGSLIAVNIDSELLKKIFAAFLFFMGIYECCAKKEKANTK